MDPWYDTLNGTNDEEPVFYSANDADGLRRLLELLRNAQATGEFEAYLDLNSPPPAAKEAVKNLKRVVTNGNTGEQCAICLREIGDDTVLTSEDLDKFDPNQMTMPCGHNFHESCLQIWLDKTNSCPVCRFELPTDNAQYEEMRLQKKREKERQQNVDTLHNSMYS